MVKREEGTMMNCEIWIELIWYESVDINGNKKWMIWVMNDENDIPVIVFSNIELEWRDDSRIVRYEWKWMWIEMNEMG